MKRDKHGRIVADGVEHALELAEANPDATVVWKDGKLWRDHLGRAAFLTKPEAQRHHEQHPHEGVFWGIWPQACGALAPRREPLPALEPLASPRVLDSMFEQGYEAAALDGLAWAEANTVTHATRIARDAPSWYLAMPRTPDGRPAVDRINWGIWTPMPKWPLVTACALATGMQPDLLAGIDLAALPVSGWVASRRLTRVAIMFRAAQAVFDGPNVAPAEFCTWAAGAGWELPEPMLGAVQLSDTERCLLQAALRLGATCESRRNIQAAIEEPALGTDTVRAASHAFARLRKLGLFRVKTGRGGGCWLSDAGVHLAQSIENSYARPAPAPRQDTE